MTLQSQYSVVQVCTALQLARSAFYYHAPPAIEAELRESLEEIALEFPRYGYRRITVELKRRGWAVNHKRVLRLMRESHLLVDVRQYCRTTCSAHAYGRYPNRVRGLVITHPDQVWVGDITYIRVHRDFLYLAVLMDVYTRSIRGWALQRQLTEDLALAALQQALQTHIPEIHHSDQGIQYASAAYTQVLTERAIQISMAARGQPRQNAFAERLMRTLKEEEVYLHEYQDYADARQHVAEFLDDVYTYKRVHSALGYLTPAEFETNYWTSRPS